MRAPALKKSEERLYHLRSKDVAHIIDCSPDDVILHAREGRMKARKKGRFWRFQIKDVKAFMQKEKGLRGG